MKKNNDIDEDYVFIRDQLRQLVEQGEKALASAEAIVEETNHPRAIEVLSSLLKTQADNVGKLMALHKEKKIVKQIPAKASGEQPTIGTQQNTMINMTSSDLSKLLEDVNNKSHNVIDVETNKE